METMARIVEGNKAYQAALAKTDGSFGEEVDSDPDVLRTKAKFEKALEAHCWSHVRGS